jgi:hypothetical protein
MAYFLSFYGSKMILDRPNNVGQVPIVLDGSNLFCSGPNHFGEFQNLKISPEKSNLNLTQIIWTQPKQFVPVKIIWTKIILELLKDKAFV